MLKKFVHFLIVNKLLELFLNTANFHYWAHSLPDSQTRNQSQV